MEPLRRGGGGGGRKAAGLALLTAAAALLVWGIVAVHGWQRQQQQLPLRARLVSAMAGRTHGAVGPCLQPWVHNRSCPVYILDALVELAPHAGVPQCNISNTKVGKALVHMP